MSTSDALLKKVAKDLIDLVRSSSEDEDPLNEVTKVLKEFVKERTKEASEVIIKIEQEARQRIMEMDKNYQRLVNEAGMRMKNSAQASSIFKSQRDEVQQKLNECERVMQQQVDLVSGLQKAFKESEGVVKGLKKGEATLQRKLSECELKIEETRDQLVRARNELLDANQEKADLEFKASQLQEEVQKMDTKLRSIKKVLEEDEEIKSQMTGCRICGSITTYRCSKCKNAFYCSSGCRKKDSAHKILFCKN